MEWWILQKRELITSIALLKAIPDFTKSILERKNFVYQVDILLIFLTNSEDQ